MKIGGIVFVLFTLGTIHPGKCEAQPFGIYGFYSNSLVDDPYDFFDSATGGGIGIEAFVSPKAIISVEYAIDRIHLSDGYSEVVELESGPDSLDSFRGSSLEFWVGHSLLSLTDFRVFGKLGLGAAQLSSDTSPQGYGWGTQYSAGLEGQLILTDLLSMKIGAENRNVKNDPGWVHFFGIHAGVAFAY